MKARLCEQAPEGLTVEASDPRHVVHNGACVLTCQVFLTLDWQLVIVGKLVESEVATNTSKTQARKLCFPPFPHVRYPEEECGISLHNVANCRSMKQEARRALALRVVVLMNNHKCNVLLNLRHLQLGEQQCVWTGNRGLVGIAP